MDWMAVLQFVLHPDQQLGRLLEQYGTFVYAILFAILFCETGLVVTPFLPGDSLLFVAGALWAATSMDVVALGGTLVAGALCGDNCNYWIGRAIGKRLLQARRRWINEKALHRTEQFYARHGGKTVVIARFVPLVRTFAPFVAGLGHMRYARFLAFSIGGALLWVGLLVSLGYWFGNVTWVKQHFGIVTIAIIALSLTPLALELLRHAWRSRSGGMKAR
ncbi:MAG TPA: VTT domain-containing protein [Casimicrobiaceae bacterium]|nr:VTT domain-containing protein [Casimicrobiaceae bacterium]